MRKNISREEARALLLKFLLQKGILPLYFANVMDQKHYPSTELLTRKERIKQICFNIIEIQFSNHYPLACLFGHSEHSFIWSATPEGHAYWANMRRDWEKFLKKKKVSIDSRIKE